MSKFFAQIFVKATAVFGKAFVTAYQQAVKGVFKSTNLQI